MSGLVAVIAAPGSEPVTEDEVDRLASDYEALRGAETIRQHEGCARGRVTAFRRPGEPTGPTRKSPSWLVAVGTIYPRRDWTRRHEDELDDADGQFVAISFDAATGDLVVANDPFGMYSVYVAQRAGRVYVSTSSLALARHLQVSASPLAIQTFLLLGYQFGAATYWDAIRRLEPGTAVVINNEGVREWVYWRPSVDDRVEGMPMKRAVDNALEVAIATYQAYLSENPAGWADLTGGMDSRLLCLLLDAAGVEFAANTRQTRAVADVDIARRIASARSWEWVEVQLPPPETTIASDRLAQGLAWGDGQLEVLQLARVLSAHQRLAESRPLLMSAGGGEHFQFWGWQTEFMNAGRSRHANLERWIDMLLLKPVDDTMLAARPRSAVREHLIARLRPRLELYRDHLNTTQLDALFAYRSTGHFGAYRSADGVYLEAQLPFYLKPVFSAAFSTDFRLRQGHELMKHMIYRLDPSVARIPTTRGGPAVPWKPWRAHQFLPYYQVLGRKAVNKVSARVFGKPLFLRTRVYPWQADLNAALLASISGSGLVDARQMRISSLLTTQRFDSFLEESLRPGFTGSTMLGRILTAEMALRATGTELG